MTAHARRRGLARTADYVAQIHASLASSLDWRLTRVRANFGIHNGLGPARLQERDGVVAHLAGDRSRTRASTRRRAV
jgi:hypothetical protein